MNKRKNGHKSLSSQQILIGAVVLIFLVSTGLLGGLIELVVGLTLGMVGLVLGLVFGLIGLVLGLLPIIIPIAIVVAILKAVNSNPTKQKNDFI